jgi:hypothetical protein
MRGHIGCGQAANWNKGMDEQNSVSDSRIEISKVLNSGLK